MISNKNNVANAVGGKTARACDSCIKKRARWYCAADDAFLCQACDASVHSANPLARRHERVRLKTASFKSSSRDVSEYSVPSWHRGFTRKARTPRHQHVKLLNHQTTKPNQPAIENTHPLVPEVGADEISREENEEEQLLYRVPIFDPFAAELCTSTNSNEAEKTATNEAETAEHGKGSSESKADGGCYGRDADTLHGFPPADMDLAEFAADVESLLGRGFENESFAMEDLGLKDYKENEIKECSLGNCKVKLEEEEVYDVNECKVDGEIDMERETFEFNFDYGSPATCGEEDGIKGEAAMETSTGEYGGEGAKNKKRKILLNLDYEAVITAWASQGSPWTNGSMPDFDLDERWPDCLGCCGTEVYQPYVDLAGIGAHQATADGGREARVSRYREKRRTRLFSKKIRYEVRKLNAEKRPRMKGRFVKRASFTGPPACPFFNN